MKLHNRLLLALVLGLFFGTIFHQFKEEAVVTFVSTSVFQPIGQIFLRLIFMVLVPLVFSALVLGVVELGKGRGLGMVATKTIVYTIIASAISVFVGIFLVNTLQPGRGLEHLVGQADKAAVTTIQSNAEATKPFSQIITELFTRNPLDSAVKALDGEMLAFMIFTLIFGFGLSMLVAEKEKNATNVLVPLLEETFAVCMKIIEYAMLLAPFAVFAIVFNTSMRLGLDVFRVLSFYVAVVVLGLLIQQFVVYSVLLKLIAKRSPLAFFKTCREVYLYAFSTASSNATLPRSLELAEKKLHIPKKISRFVLTIGATANQNGTALFEGITVLFLAQVYGIDLSMNQQIQVVLMSILAGIGTAGVPGGSLPLIMILLQSVGVPPEGLGLILGVDRFLDMCRTTLNVSGDLVIAALVSGSTSSSNLSTPTA
jgi:DAACS family dicarboxylate/amino acid:cation (Na+ or H+) symporter